MQKLVDGYWIFGLIACLFCLLNVRSTAGGILVFAVLICMFFTIVLMRIWVSPNARKNFWPLELQMSIWKNIGFWVALFFFQVVYIPYSMQMFGDTFIVSTPEYPTWLPEQLQLVLKPLAPLFCIFALFFILIFDILFCLKAIQLWKQMVENDKADREKNNNVPKQ